MELQKVHAMNRRMNEGFATLELRCRNLHNHNQAMMSEVLNLVDHLRDNLGKELDNKRLAGFLRGVSALMPPQQPLHQVTLPGRSFHSRQAREVEYHCMPWHCAKLQNAGFAEH